MTTYSGVPAYDILIIQIDRLEFDLLGRLTNVIFESPGSKMLTGTLPGGTVLAEYQYRGTGFAMLSRRVLTDYLTRCEYDDIGRMVRLQHFTAGGSVISDLAWLYDAGDRRCVS